MSEPADPAHWINRKNDDLDFPMNDELLEALNHRPKPAKDLSGLTFNQYLHQMGEKNPSKAFRLFLNLDRLRIEKMQ